MNELTHATRTPTGWTITSVRHCKTANEAELYMMALQQIGAKVPAAALDDIRAQLLAEEYFEAP